MLFPPSTSTDPVTGELADVPVGVPESRVAAVGVAVSSAGTVEVGGVVGASKVVAVAGAEVLVGIAVGAFPVGVPQADRVTAMNMLRTPNVYLTVRDISYLLAR
jgi:hypothetical protein